MSRRTNKYRRSKKIKRSKPQRQYTTTESRGVDHPELTDWSYIQSQQQAFFFFSQDIITPTPTNPDDAIGIFKGDICVGWGYIGDIASGGTRDIPMSLADEDIVFNMLNEEQCLAAGGIYDDCGAPPDCNPMEYGGHSCCLCTVHLCETTGTCSYPSNGTYFYPGTKFKYYNSETGEISNLVNHDGHNFLLNNNQIFFLPDYPLQM